MCRLKTGRSKGTAATRQTEADDGRRRWTSPVGPFRRATTSPVGPFRALRLTETAPGLRRPGGRMNHRRGGARGIYWFDESPTCLAGAATASARGKRRKKVFIVVRCLRAVCRLHLRPRRMRVWCASARGRARFLFLTGTPLSCCGQPGVGLRCCAKGWDHGGLAAWGDACGPRGTRWSSRRDVA